jgi:hypothetical protein
MRCRVNDGTVALAVKPQNGLGAPLCDCAGRKKTAAVGVVGRVPHGEREVFTYRFCAPLPNVKPRSLANPSGLRV